jgi:hypothetical protein
MSPVYTFGGRKEEEVRSTYRQIYGFNRETFWWGRQERALGGLDGQHSRQRSH